LGTLSGWTPSNMSRNYLLPCDCGMPSSRRYRHSYRHGAGAGGVAATTPGPAGAPRTSSTQPRPWRAWLPYPQPRGSSFARATKRVPPSRRTLARGPRGFSVVGCPPTPVIQALFRPKRGGCQPLPQKNPRGFCAASSAKPTPGYPLTEPYPCHALAARLAVGRSTSAPAAFAWRPTSSSPRAPGWRWKPN